jgi:putative transposase
MGSTFHSLHYHLVFSTKERRPWIAPEWRPLLHQYLGGTVRGLEGLPLEIGGIEDHVHLLIGLKPTNTIADFVRELKKTSSVWAAREHASSFAWQEGYSIFTVSRSQINVVREYIRNQEAHHQKQDFREELITLLKKHGIEFDPQYLE